MLAIVAKLLMAHLVIAMMLGIGLSTRPRDLVDVGRRPLLYAKALAVMWIAVPLLAMAIVSALGLRRAPAELILLMAVCPGAPFIPSVTKREGEQHSVVGLNLLLLTSLLAPLLVPAWVAILDRSYRFDIGISPAQVLTTILPTVLLPLLVGFAIRSVSPRAAELLTRPVHYFFIAALVVVAGVVLYLGAPVLLHVRPEVYVAVVLLVLGAALLGYWAARPVLAERRTVSMAAALGNPGLALAVLAVSHPTYRAAAFVFAYVLFRKLALLPFAQWLKHRERRDQRRYVGTAMRWV